MKMKILITINLLCAALLLACGGGSIDVAGGVGSGGSGLASGTVTGFGSVIVDGVTYDDSASVTQAQGGDGALQTMQAQLGEQVHVVHDGANAAQRIEIRASLAGPVSSAFVSSTGLLEVLGQPVRLVQTTDQSTTATVLSGYDLTSTPAVIPLTSDVVKVHGLWVNEGTDVSPNYVLQATRLEKIATLAGTAYLVSGRVVSQSTTTATLNKIGGLVLQLPSATSDSDGVTQLTSLSTGQPLAAWVNATLWSSTSHAWIQSPLPTLRARDAGPRVATGKTAQVSGVVDKVDSATSVITVQAIKVLIPSSFTLPLKGQVVQLQLVTNVISATPAWMAQQIQTRAATTSDLGLGADISLKEKIANVSWTQSRPFLLTLRGVTVQVTGSTQVTACQASSVGSLVMMKVTAVRPTLGAALLVARSVVCTAN
jgi:hypothetical protein